MAQSIRISDDMYDRAQQTGVALGRSLAQQFEYWARLGAAVDAAGITSMQAAQLLGSNAGVSALVESITQGIIDDVNVGSPMLRDWHAKLEREVATGQRTARSLIAFDRAAVRASKQTYQLESSKASEDAGW